MYKHFLKRFFDIIFSLICLPFLAIIFLIVGPLILIDDGFPIFYVAERIGKNEKAFRMIKFRSMKNNTPDLRTVDGETYNSADDKRLTRMGKVLRKLSIDETPQIINVLKGDMSLIGPRPNINDKSHDQLSNNEIKRLQVRPGITGYNQAFFRNSITMAKKFENDVFYVNNISFAFDVKILLHTFITVLRKKNIYTGDDEKK